MEYKILYYVIGGAVVFVALVIFLAFACENKLTEGKVISKHYEPGHSSTSTGFGTSSNGQSVTTFHSTYEPQKFIITIEGEYKGKMIEEDHEIYESLYTQIKIGQHINLEEL